MVLNDNIKCHYCCLFLLLLDCQCEDRIWVAFALLHVLAIRHRSFDLFFVSLNAHGRWHNAAKTSQLVGYVIFILIAKCFDNFYGLLYPRMNSFINFVKNALRNPKIFYRINRHSSNYRLSKGDSPHPVNPLHDKSKTKHQIPVHSIHLALFFQLENNI